MAQFIRHLFLFILSICFYNSQATAWIPSSATRNSQSLVINAFNDNQCVRRKISCFRTRIGLFSRNQGFHSHNSDGYRYRKSESFQAVAVNDAESNLSLPAVVEDQGSSCTINSRQGQSIPNVGLSIPNNLKNLDRDEILSKSINAIFLVVCFGLAVYSILDINHGITRGWTQQEIALRIPLDTWSSYEAALEEKPVVTKTMINVIIYLLGDWLSQTVFAKRNLLDFDLSRTLRNGLIGLGFGPLVHEYYQFSDAVLPVDGGLANRILKICMDQTIYLSVKCSLYIMSVNTLQGESFQNSFNAVKEKLPGVVVTAWKFWPLVHCITYSVIPARHRILWVNCVDLVWNAILASMSQKKEVGEQGVGKEEEELMIFDEMIELEKNIHVSMEATFDEPSTKAADTQRSQYSGHAKVMLEKELSLSKFSAVPLVVVLEDSEDSKSQQS